MKTGILFSFVIAGHILGSFFGIYCFHKQAIAFGIHLASCP